MNTGAMVAHFLPVELASRLSTLAHGAMPDYAEPAEALHLTVVYLGEAATINAEQRQMIKSELTQLTHKIAPINGTLNGIGRFVDSDPNAVIANFDAPGLASLRTSMIAMSRLAGIEPPLNHGFTPHVTLAYLPADKVMPALNFTPTPCVIETLALALADERSEYPLVGKVSLSEMAMDDDLNETSYDASASDDSFAYAPKGEPPSARKFKIGDAAHVKLAVSAFVNWSFRGNTPDIPASAKPGMKRKIMAAIHKHLTGDEAKYYAKWLSTGKKPEAVHEMVAFNVPFSAVQTLPDVPLAPGVNLVGIDPSPVFVTRPLGVVGGVSDNGLEYDDYLLSEIERQILDKRPPARRGHVAEADKDWKVPESVGYWVGAQRVGDTLYGKAYILPNNPFRDEIKVVEAIGGELSNSIYGDASLVMGDDGTMKCVGLKLESIDFVPPERAALKALGGEFTLTSEMKQGEDSMAEHNDAAADREEIIRTVKPEALKEMLSEEQRHHVAEAHLKECGDGKFMEMIGGRLKEIAGGKLYESLHEAHRQHIAEAFAKEKGLKLVKEDAVAETKAKEETVAEAKAKEESVAEMTSLKGRLSEMETTIKRYQRDEFERAVDAAVDAEFADWHVSTDKGKTTLKTLKGELRFRAMAEMSGLAGGQKPENIAQAMALAAPHIQPLKEMALANLSGPSGFVGVHSAPGGGPNKYGWDASTGRYSDEAAAAALRKTNMLGGREGGSK